MVTQTVNKTSQAQARDGTWYPLLFDDRNNYPYPGAGAVFGEPLTGRRIKEKAHRCAAAKVIREASRDEHVGDAFPVGGDVALEHNYLTTPHKLHRLRWQIMYPRDIRPEDSLVLLRAYCDVLVVPIAKINHDKLL